MSQHQFKSFKNDLLSYQIGLSVITYYHVITSQLKYLAGDKYSNTRKDVSRSNPLGPLIIIIFDHHHYYL